MEQMECRLFPRTKNRFDLRIGGMWALRLGRSIERVGYVVGVGCQVEQAEQRVMIEGIEDVVQPKKQQVTTVYWHPLPTTWAVDVGTGTTWTVNT